MNIQPKISCLCITRNKSNMLERVIRCFQTQTYPNKELFILFESDDTVAQSTLAKYIGLDNIVTHCEEVNPKKTLGELRNIAIANCSGDYFCQWDDDDWFSCNRLEVQRTFLNNNPAMVLDQWFIFDSISNTAYLSKKRHWEGSILCRKDAIPDLNYYPAQVRGEDTVLIDNLLKDNKLLIQSSPYLYIYHYYGSNTWDSSHWKGIFDASRRLDSFYSKDIAYIFNEKYEVSEAAYRLEQLYNSLI